jgi:hypothetical protein
MRKFPWTRGDGSLFEELVNSGACFDFGIGETAAVGATAAAADAGTAAAVAGASAAAAAGTTAAATTAASTSILGLTAAQWSILGTGLSSGGSLLSAVGSQKEGAAQSAMYNYQSAVNANNATIATQNSNYSIEAGESQAENLGLQTGQQVGGEKAAEAASGLDVNTGSPTRVRASSEALGKIGQNTIRNNAALQAYGYQSQAAGFTATSQLETSAAQESQLAGFYGAASSVLAGGGQFASKWSDYALKSGINAAGNVYN